MLGCLSFSVLDNFLILGTTYTHFIHISPNIVSFFSSQGVGWFLILFYVYKSTGSFLIARTSLYHNISLYQLFCAVLPGMGALPSVVRVKEIVETKCNDLDNSCVISLGCKRIQIKHAMVYSRIIHINGLPSKWYFAYSISFVA